MNEFIESNILDLQNFVLNDFSIRRRIWQAVFKNMWQIVREIHIMTKIGGYMNLKYSSDLPYPEIIVEENVQESKLLMPSYSGVASELTAILTYSFQSYITLQLPEIRDVIEGIAQTEMLHHELLGTTITKLGGFPVMGARSYWNGSFVNYTLDPKKFLKQNRQFVMVLMKLMLF